MCENFAFLCPDEVGGDWRWELVSSLHKYKERLAAGILN